MHCSSWYGVELVQGVADANLSEEMLRVVVPLANIVQVTFVAYVIKFSGVFKNKRESTYKIQYDFKLL